MPINREVEGDLLDLFDAGEFEAIVHGCNCFHKMGAGIARQIAERYPEAVEADKKTRAATWKAGTWSIAKLADGRRIINLYTQMSPGRERQETLINTLSTGFLGLSDLRGLESKKPLKVGIPLIGAGIAAGDWATHEAIINEVSPNLDITLVRWSKA